MSAVEFQLTHSRGVRRAFRWVHPGRGRFQLTHSRGVRRPRIRTAVAVQKFQLTHSRGVRLRAIVAQGNTLSISTHALTWSATCAEYADLSDGTDFNSRTHVECDNDLAIACRPLMDFNSRTHVECDHAVYNIFHVAGNFNSRTHVECDHIASLNNLKHAISTHALTWSATA